MNELLLYCELCCGVLNVRLLKLALKSAHSYFHEANIRQLQQWQYRTNHHDPIIDLQNIRFVFTDGGTIESQ